MRRVSLVVVLVAVIGVGLWYYQSAGADPETAAGGAGASGRRGGGPGARPPMTVEMVAAARHEIVDYVGVVGNLIGEATVDVVPRVAGRLEAVSVQLGDRVTKGQQVAKIEDREIREQINEAEANLGVNQATLTQRESDALALGTTLERIRLQHKAGLVATQALEDAETRHAAAVSQVTGAKAQMQQTRARIEGLKITLSNTTILSPVDGFVSRRLLDPGAFAGANTQVLSVVAIGTVRLVASVVEKDFKRVQVGVPAVVEVDTFPGEQFMGQVSRVAPVFDPATRTAQIEIEVPNPGFRLKPGMYARVRLTVERRANALTVPRNALVDMSGRRGVFVVEEQTARFQEVRTGLQDAERVEVIDGVAEGQRVVTTGALALRDGDRVLLASEEQGNGNGRGVGGRGQGGRGRSTNQGQGR
jgi:RND family efflux transporter MFP subunit